MSDRDSQPKTISNVQVLRGLAALAVVLYHTAYVLPLFGHTEFYGVAVFFVISGFIMTYITRASADRFLLQRVTRIVPLYWVATILRLLWSYLGFANPVNTFPQWEKWIREDSPLLGTWFSAQFAALESPALLKALAKSLLFIPYQDAAGNLQPVLGVGWTLNLEMFFYLLFAAALALSVRWAPALVCVTLVAIKLASHGLTNPILSFYAHGYTTYFIYGIGAFYVWRALPDKLFTDYRLGVASVATAIILVFIAGNTVAFSNTWPRLVRFMPATLVLAGMALHSAGFRCSWKAPIVLGNISYALYLTHTTVLETLRTIGARWPILNFKTSLFGLMVGIATSCLVALATYYCVEMPMLRCLRRQPAAPAVVATALPVTRPISKRHKKAMAKRAR